MRTLRPCQSELIEAVRKAFAGGKKGVCVEAFTGFGKAFVLSAIAKMVREKGGKVLCLVNRDNLCEQLFTSLCEQGLHPLMERGQDKASPMSELVVGSVQTMQGDRLKKWNRDHFRMVICDEVHFAAADTFKATLNHFEPAFHLGMTATLQRHDKKGLWHGYQDNVFSMPLVEGIAQGWLVPLQFKELPVPIVVNEKAATKKMFTEKDEVELFDKDDYLPRLFTEAAKECVGKKALMFWPGCKASEEATKYFCANGIESRHVDGYMSKSKIAEILEWFKHTKEGALNNADLLSYGYDNPSINLVGIMRLQKSIPMLLQRIGRGTRTVRDGLLGVDSFGTSEERRKYIATSSKPSCEVLDLMLQIEGAKHNFATPGCLITAAPDEQEYIRKQRASGKQVDLTELEGMLKTKRTMDEEKSLVRLAEDAVNAARRRYFKTPFIADILKANYAGEPPASHKQKGFLRSLGYTGIEPLTIGQASRIIARFLAHKQKAA